MSSRLHQIGHWTRQVLLSAGAVVGALSILVTVGAALFGLRPLVFESGSMSPTIETGALAIARQIDAASLEVGQVVSVPAGNGERVTHRIVSVTQDGDAAVLRLRGDANEVTDQTPYRVTHADKVLFDIPLVGYVIGWLTGPVGLFALGLYAAFLLSIVLKRPSGPRSEPTDPSDRRRVRAVPARRAAARRGPRRIRVSRPAPRRRSSSHRLHRLAPSALLAAGAVSGLALPLQVTPTLAAWGDQTPVAGTSLAAYTVPAPDGSTCTLITPGTTSVRGVRLTWPATAAPLPPLSYTTPTVTGGITTITNSVTTVGPNKVLTVTYNPNTTANRNKIVTVTDRAYPTGAATWLSPITTWKFRTGGNQNAQPVCGDAIPPSFTFQAPDSTTRTVADEKTFISGPSGCTVSSVILCGTIDDASNFVVTYTLKRTQGATVRCWSGTAWATNCTTFRAASSQVVGDLTSWYVAGNQATVYPTTGAGNYELTVRATDDWANVTTGTLNFTLT